MTHTPRRFPYWKVQWHDDIVGAWRDIQRAHYAIGEAIVAADRHTNRTGRRTRLMRVDRGGRQPE